MEPDFSGWATKPDILCTDGRTIKPDAFAHMDGQKVPMVWSHNHKDVEKVLGHVLLEAKDGGLRAHGFFNTTPAGMAAKIMVHHGDVDSLSIWANKLIEKSKQVFHGMVREVSLVLAGANKGAKIDYINLAHGDDGDYETLDDEAIIAMGITLDVPEDATHASGDQPTLQSIWDSLSPVQKEGMQYLIGTIVDGQMGQSDEADEPDEPEKGEEPDKGEPEDNLTHKEGTTEVTKNVFESADTTDKSDEPGEVRVLSHDEMQSILRVAKRTGQTLASAVEAFCLSHGIDNMDILFPNAKNITGTPDFIKRRTEWVAGVLNGVSNVPFARIKTLLADITQDEARAKGYIKGTLKKEEFFSVTKRTTSPTTVYKKQKLDRDDILDLTDFDVVVWVKSEMRLMLEEELARAILIGDGRDVGDADKIKDPAGQQDGTGIRSILNDHEIYVDHISVQLDATTPDYNDIVERVLLGRENMFGTGQPTFYVTRSLGTKMLLAKDTYGRRRFQNNSELAAAMDVAGIVYVDVMKSVPTVGGILVNLVDYAVGTDKGGEVNFFDFFDIDYNQEKYLIETRLSGALTKYKSAQVVDLIDPTWVEVVPTEPTFDSSTGVVTIVATTHITYKDAITGDTLATGAQPALAVGESMTVVAVPASGYFVDDTNSSTWTFTRIHA